MIYLDNASTSYVYPECMDAIQECLSRHWGNPSNRYTLGDEPKRIIKEAREKIAKAINCSPEEIFFTSGASEGNAWACAQRDYALISPYEHHNLTDRKDAYVVDDDHFNRCLNKELAFKDWFAEEYCNHTYHHMLVSNETGEIFNVNPIFDQAHELNIFVSCDCTQALGNIKIDIKKIHCDMAVFSGHKVHAPKGTGFVYIKKERQDNIIPLIYGTQQNGLRGGTENVPYIKALGIAVEKACNEIKAKEKHCAMLKDIVLKELYEEDIDFIETTSSNTIEGTLSIALADVESEIMQNMLSDKGIFIGTGSGCTTGLMENNATLEAMGIEDKYIRGPIRLSFSLENSKEDVELSVRELIDCYKTLTK